MLSSGRPFQRSILYLIRRAFASETTGPTAATGGKLVLTLTSPHATHINGVVVDQVNINAVSGSMGILANHVPTIQQLKPGLIETVTGGVSKKLCASGGFAVMNPDSTLNVSVTEAFSLDAFSPEVVQRNLSEAQKFLVTATTEKDKVEAEIVLEVYQALAQALSGGTK